MTTPQGVANGSAESTIVSHLPIQQETFLTMTSPHLLQIPRLPLPAPPIPSRRPYAATNPTTTNSTTNHPDQTPDFPPPVTMEQFNARMEFFLDIGEKLLLLHNNSAHQTSASLRDLKAKLEHKIEQNDLQLGVFFGWERRREWVKRIEAQNVKLLEAVEKVDAVLKG